MSKQPSCSTALNAPNLIARIQQKKRALNAVVLAHNYIDYDLINEVADVTGDSLTLALEAQATQASIIVVAGVRFMAETAKLLNPSKKVILPSANAGCSLAESITANDVASLRQAHPDIPVVTYVNTTAAVKAESDICCTSANAVAVVESFGVDRVILIPDEFLAANVAQRTKVDIITWPGRCEVHEEFTRDDLIAIRKDHETVKILAHPECRPDVVEAADFCGSTTAMSRYVRDWQPDTVALITECTMRNNLAIAHPNVRFMGPCDYCPHMRQITLEGILNGLLNSDEIIEVEAAIAAPARRALQGMLDLELA